MKDTLTRLGKALTATPAAVSTFRAFGGGYFAFPRNVAVDEAFHASQQASYAAIYAGQPNVRAVVDYIATTAADRSLKCYERRADGERAEDGDHPAGATMREPNDWQGEHELIEAWFKDFLVYDNAYIWDLGPSEGSRRFLVRVPPYAMGVAQDNQLRPYSYRINFVNGTWIDLKPEEVIHLRGYSALSNRGGVSRMETLRQLIIEESVRTTQAIEFVRSGMVKGGIIERPLEAPEWSDTARERFEESWAGRVQGLVRGKSPVLEEGMTFTDAGVTPREAESIRNRELNMAVVCRTYGIHPAIFGIESAGADIEAARDQLEEDVAEPLASRAAEALTTQLIGNIYGDFGAYFFEFAWRQSPRRMVRLFDSAAKAAGGPVVTPNEYRRTVLNLPPIEGGDELVVPNNVVRAGGDLPTPSTMPLNDFSDRGRPAGSEDSAGARSVEPEEVRLKALIRRNATRRRRDDYAADHGELFRKHFRRQLASLGPEGKAELDDARWDRELAADLAKAGARVVQREGAIVSERLLSRFDYARADAYVKTGAKAAARNVNASTRDLIADARDRGVEDPEREVLNAAITGRSDSLAAGRATALVAFATTEAAAQTGGHRVKTWVGSGLPQSRHTDISGETVAVGEAFSNGCQFPGDPDGGAEEVAGCQCLVDVA